VRLKVLMKTLLVADPVGGSPDERAFGIWIANM
jgi:hypothetical protein